MSRTLFEDKKGYEVHANRKVKREKSHMVLIWRVVLGGECYFPYIANLGVFICSYAHMVHKSCENLIGQK